MSGQEARSAAKRLNEEARNIGRAGSGRALITPSDSTAAKPPCRHPLPDGRRCCECDACQGTSAATVAFEEQHAHNMHVLGLIRDEPAWALARILRCEALEARRHYTRRMLQALDIYWFCAEGLPKGRYPRGRYTAEDWWNRYERYRALVEESIVV